MKKLQIFTTLSLVLGCASLTSCGLINSAAKVPTSLLQAVSRTVGMTVNQKAEPTPEQPDFDVIGDGVIQQLD